MEFRSSWPALLSIAGRLILTCFGLVILGFFTIAMFFIGRWLTPSDALPYASIGLSGLLGLVFSPGLFFDDAHRRRLGILVLVSCGAAAYFLAQFFLTVFPNSVRPLPAGDYTLASAPILGLAGAIWESSKSRTQPLPA